MNEKELEIVVNFLKFGHSTRRIERIIGHPDKKGWIAWDVLKKYGFKDSDKGKLFLYPSTNAKKIIKKVINEHLSLDSVISTSLPEKLEIYRDTFVIAKNETAFYNILKGETRNIIRDFFTPQKKIKGKCQFQDCTYGGELETAHYLKDRPELFKDAAYKNKELLSDGWFKFDVYTTMKMFLENHKKSKSVCFLCKTHHNTFHKLEKNLVELRKFKKLIKFE